MDESLQRCQAAGWGGKEGRKEGLRSARPRPRSGSAPEHLPQSPAVPKSCCPKVLLSQSPAAPEPFCPKALLSQSPAVPEPGCPRALLSQSPAVPKSCCPKALLSQSPAVPKSCCPKVPLPQSPAAPKPCCPRARLSQSPAVPKSCCPKALLSQSSSIPGSIYPKALLSQSPSIPEPSCPKVLLPQSPPAPKPGCPKSPCPKIPLPQGPAVPRFVPKHPRLGSAPREGVRVKEQIWGHSGNPAGLDLGAEQSSTKRKVKSTKEDGTWEKADTWRPCSPDMCSIAKRQPASPSSSLLLPAALFTNFQGSQARKKSPKQPEARASAHAPHPDGGRQLLPVPAMCHPGDPSTPGDTRVTGLRALPKALTLN
ncbi:hypothetical protein DV515_00013989 [Chloebia gouldiae]|uniref:Uncharacterized protein n=1 Tax=Chloebia gouldiae TaxID=44316 RepID=A0A3L8S0I4_CHLGU|nr:hypothetical protein DV515_00013989 [Chloebia gouldiae]